MKEELYELALFAGGGGGLLGSKLLGWFTICYVEWNAYAVEVLKARIRDGCLDDAPIWDDCFSFDGTPWCGLVDVISAGFPCQPFSQAGKGLAEDDPRNGWPAVKRIIGEVRPKVAWLENVPGIISKPYIRRIFGDLAEIGYDAEWGCLSAAAVGASHLRERLWIVAYPTGQPFNMGQQSWQEDPGLTRSRTCGIVTNTNDRLPSIGNGSQTKNRSWMPTARRIWRPTQSPICGGNDDVAHRVDRLATIGNGQVPEVARTAWELLTARISQDPK